MKFYRNERIEEIAEQRLQEFEGKLGRPLSLPIDIELFGGSQCYGKASTSFPARKSSPVCRILRLERKTST
jgi:hypothetical protein